MINQPIAIRVLNYIIRKRPLGFLSNGCGIRAHNLICVVAGAGPLRRRLPAGNPVGGVGRVPGVYTYTPRRTYYTYNNKNIYRVCVCVYVYVEVHNAFAGHFQNAEIKERNKKSFFLTLAQQKKNVGIIIIIVRSSNRSHNAINLGFSSPIV